MHCGQRILVAQRPYDSPAKPRSKYTISVVAYAGDIAMKMPYCSECTINENAGPSHAITNRQRLARVVVGVICFALGWAFLRIPVPAIAWPLAITAGWFGISHLIAACIAYPDCPELGAIATLVSRRYIRTRCGPWARLDQWLESRS